MVALDLDDAYNRVDSRILLRTFKNMKINPYLIIWIGEALLKRKVAPQVSNRTSDVKSITLGQTQYSALSSVLFYVYTVGITSNRFLSTLQYTQFCGRCLSLRVWQKEVGC